MKLKGVITLIKKILKFTVIVLVLVLISLGIAFSIEHFGGELLL